MDKRIGLEVHALRRERGLSLQEAAAALGTEAAWLGLAERGLRSFSVGQLACLCRVLGAPQFVVTAEDATISPAP